MICILGRAASTPSTTSSCPGGDIIGYVEEALYVVTEFRVDHGPHFCVGVQLALHGYGTVPESRHEEQGVNLSSIGASEQWYARTMGRNVDINPLLQTGLVNLHFCQFVEHIHLHPKRF